MTSVELSASALAGRSQAPERAGRMCPVDYRYPPSVFDRPADLTTDTLYVAGGLYGNLAALDEIERLAACENALVVFNGDFHWFDAETGWFGEIARRVALHHAIRGNVETELARGSDVGAGCGCAYPDSVDEGTVRRSNEILLDLRNTAVTLPGAADALATMPMHLVADVGGLRIGIVHGDATALAGWSFARDALDGHDMPAKLEAIRHASRIDVFASTHTCLAALRDFRFAAGRTTVINNGAAGMPNFSGLRTGLVTRISRKPAPREALYGIERDGAYIDAIPLAYDHDRFLKRFLARWPAGSAAHASYFGRIVSGPHYQVVQAKPPAPL